MLWIRRGQSINKETITTIVRNFLGAIKHLHNATASGLSEIQPINLYKEEEDTSKIVQCNH